MMGDNNLNFSHWKKTKNIFHNVADCYNIVTLTEYFKLFEIDGH